MWGLCRECERDNPRHLCDVCGEPIMWRSIGGMRVHTEGRYSTKCGCGKKLRDSIGNRLDEEKS